MALLLISLGAAAYAEDPVIAAGPPPPAQDRCAPGQGGEWTQLFPPPMKPVPSNGHWRDGALLVSAGTKVLRYDPCRMRWSTIDGQAEPGPPASGRSYLVDGVRVVPAPDPTTSLDIFAGGTAWLPSGAKVPLPARGAPAPRSRYALALADGALIVWGGWTEEQGPVGDGAILDLKQPAAWRPISMAGAPGRRILPVVAWTGQWLVIWGGGDARDAGAPLQPLMSGGRYDPKADRWQPTSLMNAPAGRFKPVSVWTGRQLLVLGGGAGLMGGAARGATQAGLYDPETNRWTPVSGVPADLPEASWIRTFVDPHGHVLLLSTFGPMKLYFLDPARPELQEVDFPFLLSDRVAGGIAWSGKRLFLWGGGTAVRHRPGEAPQPPTPKSDTWVYEPR